MPTVAVSLGAKLLYFILDRNLGGPDSAFSMEPENLKEMIKPFTKAGFVRKVTYIVSENDRNRRSLFVVKDIKAGEPFSEENVRSTPRLRCASKILKYILGKKAKTDIKRAPFKIEI